MNMYMKVIHFGRLMDNRKMLNTNCWFKSDEAVTMVVDVIRCCFVVSFFNKWKLFLQNQKRKKMWQTEKASMKFEIFLRKYCDRAVNILFFLN